ncbi:transposable element Tcb1 transposase [Trichonephila clavipes]|nr:transposable element Tcb1 transposase [Trichonephila clavipes]
MINSRNFSIVPWQNHFRQICRKDDKVASMSFLEWTEDVLFLRREVQTVRRMFKNLPAELTYQCLARHSHMRTSIIMQDDNPAGQHSTSVVLDILSQFMQWGTAQGSFVDVVLKFRERCRHVTDFKFISVLRVYRNHYGKEAQISKSILRWCHQFKKTGCLGKKKSSGRPSVSEEAVERVRQSCGLSPRKSSRVVACEFGMPQKIDEVEKLAYQLNEEAERTERPIRRLSKVMYGSTCADMQVDVMGECLSSIKHVVGEQLIRGFSSGRPRGTTPADDRYIVLQARRNRRQTAGEIARHTTQATGRLISRFTVARRLHGGGLFARRPVRCVPLTPAHPEKAFSVVPGTPELRDNEWGRVLFTDESRFSLSSDSHRILIWREREAAIISRTSLKGTGSVNGTRYCNEILLPYVRLFRGAMGLQFLFMDDNAPCHRTVAAEQLLESRRLAARTLPPVTIRELRLALQDEWAAMPQQLIDTLILSMGRRCETCLAVRGDHIPY